MYKGSNKSQIYRKLHTLFATLVTYLVTSHFYNV